MNGEIMVELPKLVSELSKINMMTVLKDTAFSIYNNYSCCSAELFAFCIIFFKKKINNEKQLLICFAIKSKQQYPFTIFGICFLSTSPETLLRKTVNTFIFFTYQLA